ncbi:telomerase reverse transcriptase [Mercurialis annua]|uniref:telomerase reverse transcriptase n=1 Tax=Mercurialis annua TaxID=3986 RepID=UPI00216043E6|nr:telomerase reverse transcriptase [Mercurialis annua]
MAKKRKIVPVVLWRLFGDRARTLSSTITSLTPQSHGTEDATSFLLHSRDDPINYIKLLHHCFVVLDRNAPPFVAVKRRLLDNRSQHEIVVSIIEMMITERLTSSNNVLCSAYDKLAHSSPFVELLTSLAWNLLLKRVGYDLMVYLLKHASIFIPLPHNRHCQVAGPPVNVLALNLLKNAADARCQDPPGIHLGHKKKRKRAYNASLTSDMQQNNLLCVTDCVGCASCNVSYIKPLSRHAGNKNGEKGVNEAAASTTGVDSTEYEAHPKEGLVKLRKRSRPFRWRRCKKHKYSDFSESISMPIDTDPADRWSGMSAVEAGSAFSGACTVNYEGFSVKKPQGLNQVMTKAKPKGLSRLFWGQCCKKRKHLDVEEASEDSSYLMGGTDNERIPRRLQCELKKIRSHSHDKMPQRCTCCLIFQDASLVNKGAQVNRQHMFYNLEQSSSALPREHELNRVRPNFAGSKILVGSIFGLSTVNTNAPSEQCCHRSGFCLVGSACLYHSLIKCLKILIRHTRYYKKLQLLDKHCTVSSTTNLSNQNLSAVYEENVPEKGISKKSRSVSTEHGERTLSSGNPQTELVKSHCTKSQVVSFIWAICRKIVPQDLLGTPSNWRILRRNISKLIQLRRFEKISIKQCMHKLKISEFPFLSDKHSLCCLDAGVLSNVRRQNSEARQGLGQLNDAASNLKQLLLEKWIFWFFSCLVVPLLQANFYVTETGHDKQDVFYYRKSIWEELKNITIAGLKDQNYQHLDRSDVRRIIGHRLFGFSKLRLRPKENGVRMLANLKAPSRMHVEEFSSTGVPRKAQSWSKLVKCKNFKPVNYVLRDTYAVLKGTLSKEPEKLGSSVFDYNDIYRKLCLFIIGLKNGSNTIPNVYIVISDVSKAFDSIDQNQLLRVMKEVFHEDVYHLQQSSQVVCTKKSFWVHENLTLKDTDSVTSLTTMSSSARFGSLHNVLINQGYNRYMKKKDILFNLKQHVKQNVLLLDKIFYLQGIGIPQGSILSTLLCSIYYGHLERHELFPFIQKTCGATVDDLSRRCNSCDASAARNSCEDSVVSSPSHILMRLIDDMCFISTSEQQANSYYNRLKIGFQGYNCYMNEKKFCLSFRPENEPQLLLNRVYVGEDGISFLRWSGLLLNPSTLEVQADYTRYLNSHLRSSLTVSWEDKPGRRLKEKLCAFMRPKCYPIFFDSNINSGNVVRLNIYQSFLLCAMKFHCYVSEIYSFKLHPRFHLEIIDKSFRYMYALIKKSMRPMRTGSQFRPILKLEAGEVEWLGLNAFVKVLNRKQSRHQELLPLLKSKLLAHTINRNVSSQLQYAVQSSHSSVMWKIKY